jgi:hypothetical protein
MSGTICLPYRAVSAEETVRAGGKAYHVIVMLGCAAVIAASFILQPGSEGLSAFGLRWPFHCWLHETLGINCALCGMSRSFCGLAHGDLAASLAFHRLGPALFLFFCLQIPYRLYALAVQPRTIDRRLVKAHLGLVVILCAAIACNWLAYLEGLIV